VSENLFIDLADFFSRFKVRTMSADKVIPPVNNQKPHIPQAYLLRTAEADTKLPYRLCRLTIEAEKTLREQSPEWPPSAGRLKPEDFHKPQYGAQYAAKQIIYRIQTAIVLKDVIVPESQGLLEFVINHHNYLVMKVRDGRIPSHQVQELIEKEYKAFLKNPEKVKAVIAAK
jgi:hypothetical protein